MKGHGRNTRATNLNKMVSERLKFNNAEAEAVRKEH
jgi:hypothetical protein